MALRGTLLWVRFHDHNRNVPAWFQGIGGTSIETLVKMAVDVKDSPNTGVTKARSDERRVSRSSR